MLITTKRGDTFAVYCQRVDSTGAPVNLTGVTISSQIRFGTFVGTLTCTVTDAANGKFTVSATPAETSAWPASSTAAAAIKCFMDVQFDDGTYVISSELITVAVTPDMTQVTSTSTGVPAASGNPILLIDRGQPTGQISGGTSSASRSGGHSF